MGGGVQGPLEVRPATEPGVEHEGRRGLPVPARADVGQAPGQARAPVLLLAHEGEVREVSFLGGPDVVQRAEDRQGERCVGEGVLAAADDVHALTDPVGIALRQPADQRRQPRRAGVGLVDKAAEPALQARGVGGLQELRSWSGGTRHKACRACL